MRTVPGLSRTIRTALAALLFVSAPFAHAGLYEDGVAARDRGDYATALTFPARWAREARQRHKTTLLNVRKGQGEPKLCVDS
jgi:hypothetical protein